MEADAKVVEAIGQQAVNADRERLKALQTAFPSDPQLALDAYTKGWTVERAKAEQYEALTAKVKSLEEQQQQSQAAPKQPVVGFASSDFKQGNAEYASVDQVEAEALSLWNSRGDIREIHAGNKFAFFADFKRHPEDYRKK